METSFRPSTWDGKAVFGMTPPREWWISTHAPNYTASHPQPIDASWVKVVEHSAYQEATSKCEIYKRALHNIRLAVQNKKEKDAVEMIKMILEVIE